MLAGKARIRIPKHAAAFIANDGESVSVSALHGRVGVLVGRQEITIDAGQQVIVARSADATSHPVPSLAVRNLQRHTSDDASIVTCDFSIPSAVSTLEAVKDLQRTNASMYRQILKNAAALQVVTASKGAYKSMHP
jgi:hypothetical protein